MNLGVFVEKRIEVLPLPVVGDEPPGGKQRYNLPVPRLLVGGIERGIGDQSPVCYPLPLLVPRVAWLTVGLNLSGFLLGVTDG